MRVPWTARRSNQFILKEISPVIDNMTRINVSALANGMYFVRVTTEQGMVTKRFVKK